MSPIKLDTNSQIDWRGKEVLEGMRAASRKCVRAVADAVAECARGRVSVRSGLLRDNLKGRTRKDRERPDEFRAAVSTATKGKIQPEHDWIDKRGRKRHSKARLVKYGYGADVEIGRPSGGYSATPYLRPALAETIGHVPEIIRDAAAQEARKAKRGRPKAATA